MTIEALDYLTACWDFDLVLAADRREHFESRVLFQCLNLISFEIMTALVRNGQWSFFYTCNNNAATSHRKVEFLALEHPETVSVLVRPHWLGRWPLGRNGGEIVSTETWGYILRIVDVKEVAVQDSLDNARDPCRLVDMAS